MTTDSRLFFRGLTILLLLGTLYIAFWGCFAYGCVTAIASIYALLSSKYIWPTLGFLGLTLAVLLPVFPLAGFYLTVARGTLPLRRATIGWLGSTFYHAVLSAFFYFGAPGMGLQNQESHPRIPFYYISGVTMLLSALLFSLRPRSAQPPPLPTP